LIKKTKTKLYCFLVLFHNSHYHYNNNHPIITTQEFIIIFAL